MKLTHKAQKIQRTRKFKYKFKAINLVNEILIFKTIV